MKLVLLWFGSWKNSMSCYAPQWVKRDSDRFPRARLKTGASLEILSAFSSANCEADMLAFTALMRHLREVDARNQTVILVQVENEVGMLGDARDGSRAANRAFEAQVPESLMETLALGKKDLCSELRDLWASSDFREGGSWQEVFGDSHAADEVFMAWHYARYIDRIAEAGKTEYPVPMFVNAALNRPGRRPGEYPSAGPLPHLMDIWRAGAPHIDFLSPDIYEPNFSEWCERYSRAFNPLFIPEARRGDESAIHALYALGRHGAIGFSPFSIESIENPASAPLSQSYRILAQLTPLIVEHQARRSITGFVLEKERPREQIALGSYQLNLAHDHTWEWSGADRDAPSWPRTGGLAICVDTDEYLIAGSGFIVTFSSALDTPENVGIASIDEGRFEQGRWIAGRRLNGDESHQGRHVRLPPNEFGIQRVKLYRYA
jgi:beta-galactosidase GanA